MAVGMQIPGTSLLRIRIPTAPKLAKDNPNRCLEYTSSRRTQYAVLSSSLSSKSVWIVPHLLLPGKHNAIKRLPLRAGWEEVTLLWNALKTGSEAIGIYLESAPPWMYLLYLFGAGLGLPFSEDALVVWVSARMIDGRYGNWQQCSRVLLIVYLGVIASDMITFGIGSALKAGLWRGFREKLLRDDGIYKRATRMINTWSGYIGAIQRFSLGFRGPLCLFCGFLGMSPMKFFIGVALGAPLTIGVQFCVGYLLKDTSNAYLSALTLVAIPNLLGHIAGPVMTALGIYYGGRRKGTSSDESPTPQASGSQ